MDFDWPPVFNKLLFIYRSPPPLPYGLCPALELKVIIIIIFLGVNGSREGAKKKKENPLTFKMCKDLKICLPTQKGACNLSLKKKSPVSAGIRRKQLARGEWDTFWRMHKHTFAKANRETRGYSQTFSRRDKYKSGIPSRWRLTGFDVEPPVTSALWDSAHLSSAQTRARTPLDNLKWLPEGPAGGFGFISILQEAEETGRIRTSF